MEGPGTSYNGILPQFTALLFKGYFKAARVCCVKGVGALLASRFCFVVLRVLAGDTVLTKEELPMLEIMAARGGPDAPPLPKERPPVDSHCQER
eukprot:6440438-Amphidinium_carterae.1